MKEFVSSMKDPVLEFKKKTLTVSSGNISRAVIVNKHWGNIMPHCKQLSSPLLPSPPLSAGSVPDSVGRAAVQSQSRFFLWTAAFALTKQNATQQLISCSQSRLGSIPWLKEFGFFISPLFPVAFCFLQRWACRGESEPCAILEWILDKPKKRHVIFFRAAHLF